MPTRPPYTPREVQALRDYQCPYCNLATLEPGPRGRKHCTECGAVFVIPRRPASGLP